jgi:hypothetical protein
MGYKEKENRQQNCHKRRVNDNFFKDVAKLIYLWSTVINHYCD